MMCASSCKKTRRATSGFTLVELLVILAIIAILSSLLLSALQSARRRALQAACFSNEHQIWIAMRLYMDEWDGLPASQLWWQDFGGFFVFLANRVWWTSIKPRGILRCPADFGAMLAGDREPTTATVYERRGSSYMMMGEATWSDPLPYMQPDDPLVWDFVGFWHQPSRGVLDYNKGWKDDRTLWVHNVARLDGSLTRRPYWPIVSRADAIEREIEGAGHGPA